MDTPSSNYSPFDLINIVIEAAKDVQYLSWMQDLQIALVTSGAGLGLYLTTHSIRDTVIAVIISAGTHIIAMAQEGVTLKKAAALDPVVKQQLKEVQAAGDAAIAAAKVTPEQSKSDIMDKYIKDESK